MKKVIKGRISKAQAFRILKFLRRKRDWIRYTKIPTGLPQSEKVRAPAGLTFEEIAKAGGVSVGTVQRIDGLLRSFAEHEEELAEAIRRLSPARSVVPGRPNRRWQKGVSQRMPLPGRPPKLRFR